MKKQFKPLKFLIFFSVVGILGFANNSAIAGNGKTISGYNCLAFSNQDTVSYHYGMRNDLNRTNWVSCSIVRDNMAAQNQHFTNSVKVQIYKPNNGRTYCFLNSYSNSGQAGISTYSSAEVAGFQIINIPGTISSFTSGAMTVECLLNYGDTIYSINYEER